MVWDLRMQSCVRAMLQHGRQVVDLRVDWPTFQGMSCSADRSIILWDLEVAEPLQRFDKHPGSVWCLDVDWAGRRMVTGAGPGDNSIFVWDFRDGFVERQILGHEGSVWALAVDWEVAHKAFETAQGVGLQTEAGIEPPDSNVPSKEEMQSGGESPDGKSHKGKRRKKWVKRRVKTTEKGLISGSSKDLTEAAAVDAGGESLCSGCSKDEERHTLMSRQMEDQQRLQAEFESSLLVRQEKFGEDVQQLGENLHTLHSLEAASLDQLRGGLAEVHAALNREMASLSRVEDQLGELREEVTQPSPAAVQQHQQDHHAAMLASRQVSELLHQERARAAAARLRNLVAPPFKDIGSLHVAFVLWKMQSRHRVAFENLLAYREKMVDRADLQAIVTAWRSASRPSTERLLDSELQDLAKLPAPEPVREAQSMTPLLKVYSYAQCLADTGAGNCMAPKKQQPKVEEEVVVQESEDEPEEPEILTKCLRAPGQLFYGEVKAGYKQRKGRWIRHGKGQQIMTAVTPMGLGPNQRPAFETLVVSIYEGAWEEDVPCGEGRYRWSDGSSYEGNFEQGRMHGQGRFVWADGSSYEGSWFQGSCLQCRGLTCRCGDSGPSSGLQLARLAHGAREGRDCL
ncbi:PIP5K9 [Symbiodinium sp. KB8]|nr:PIP5K9 [Symbiodinium sp. KB8]